MEHFSFPTFFRNPEIKRIFFLYLALDAVFLAVGFSVSTACGVLFGAVCAVFFLLFLITSYLRYRKFYQLSQDLDLMLHNNTPIPFDNYKEGELSILENELSKMTLRLTEQAESLLLDKKYLSDAMADISHQLRSPLTASQLTLSLLRDKNLSDFRRLELLQELSQLLSHIDWLVESMLKMAKMDAQTAYLKQESVPVSLLLRQACEPHLVSMELHGQTLLLPSTDDSISFVGDLSWTTEAVSNILKNCTEHTPEGGTIRILCKRTALYTELLIEDNGEGFSPEDLPHLFERFYRGKNASPQSVGIGLALSRMILTAQNATLKAENRAEGGARFVIRFYDDTAGTVPQKKSI